MRVREIEKMRNETLRTEYILYKYVGEFIL